MTQCKCNNDFALNELINQYKSRRGALIPVLQKAQDMYGFLPKEVMDQVAGGLGLPLSQVYGVATFYSQFHLNPRGRNIIRICLGTACHVRGATKILDKIQEKLKISSGETTEDLRYTIEPVACIGACGLAPVMMVNDDTHGRLTPDKIADLLEKYE